MKKRILISAGESSGDLHAANLIKSLQTINNNVDYFGIGCAKMESLGVQLLERMDKHAIIGVWEIVANLMFIRNLFTKFSDEIKKGNVDLAILIDYPGFNLELARMLNKYNVPCIYYVTPQLWAWGKWRINSIKKYIQKALVILPFEESMYKKAHVDASFVGHPILDESYDPASAAKARASLGLKPDKFTIAILPGSRTMEIRRMLPVFMKTAKIINRNRPVQWVISRCPNIDRNLYKNIISGYMDSDILLTENSVYTCLDASDFALSVSGTVTLQAAITETPHLITYKIAPFSYMLAKVFVKIRDVGLANIIAGKLIVPEILQYEAQPEKLAKSAIDIISSDKKMELMKKDLQKVKQSLGKPGASKRAAEIISKFI